MSEENVANMPCRHCEGEGRSPHKLDSIAPTIVSYIDYQCLVCGERGIVRLKFPDSPTNCGRSWWAQVIGAVGALSARRRPAAPAVARGGRLTACRSRLPSGWTRCQQSAHATTRAILEGTDPLPPIIVADLTAAERLDEWFREWKTGTTGCGQSYSLAILLQYC
jgi:hypothetical protein